jgi:hypothetical protein
VSPRRKANTVAAVITNNTSGTTVSTNAMSETTPPAAVGSISHLHVQDRFSLSVTGLKNLPLSIVAHTTQTSANNNTSNSSADECVLLIECGLYFGGEPLGPLAKSGPVTVKIPSVSPATGVEDEVAVNMKLLWKTQIWEIPRVSCRHCTLCSHVAVQLNGLLVWFLECDRDVVCA